MCMSLLSDIYLSIMSTLSYCVAVWSSLLTYASYAYVYIPSSVDNKSTK